jgi:hypothetical protein
MFLELKMAKFESLFKKDWLVAIAMRYQLRHAYRSVRNITIYDAILPTSWDALRQADIFTVVACGSSIGDELSILCCLPW